MGFVKSVEYVEISLTAAQTSNSASLSKGQTIANCAWFYTKQIAGMSSNNDARYVDVYFEAGPQVTIARQTAAGTLTAGITVIELDISVAPVQQGTFSIADLSQTGTAAITAVNLSKAFLIFAYKINGGGNTLWGTGAIRGYFSSTTQLTFDRQTNDAGAISGHWIVVEDTGTNFDVDAYDAGITASQTQTDTTITSVTTNKTFLISSYRVIGSNDDVENYGQQVQLFSTTAVRYVRSYAKNEAIEAKLFVIEFSGDETVQRGTPTYSTTDSYFENSITSVSLARAMPWGPNIQGLHDSDGSDAGNEDQGHSKIKVLNATTVRGDRATGTLEALASWEVIEWVVYKLEGVTKDKGGSPLGSCDCHLFKLNATEDDGDFIDYDLSDGSGNYSFTGITDNDAKYFVVAWKDDTPHVFDATDHVLVPVLE